MRRTITAHAVDWLRSVAERSDAEWVIALPPGGLLAIHRKGRAWRGYYHSPTERDRAHEPEREPERPRERRERLHRSSILPLKAVKAPGARLRLDA